MSKSRSILVTGVTGLLGRSVLQRLLAADRRLRAIVLVRDPARWARVACASEHNDRTSVVVGDLRSAGLGLTREATALIRRQVTAIVHLAADTKFSNPLDAARAVNTAGTEHLLALAHECASAVRFACVSTAFVAGRRTGVITEEIASMSSGWVNAYEQSKYEAEQLVCREAADWVILRPATVVCDNPDGAVSQVNAVHRALRLYRAGLVAMMPGIERSTIDAVTTDFVADAIARLALRDDAGGKVVHLCAGEGALPLGELLDMTYAYWARDPQWRRRAIARPPLVDLATYALFERSIEEIGDTSIKRLTRSLSHFVPQLALPKVFDTSTARELLGGGAPPVRDFWLPMLERLFAANHTAVDASRAA
jgi:nucleoside-diphosphate-sugar epimerase